MNTLLQQLKQRRLQLGFKQNDMMLRIGVSRQQYQRLESKGNPRLETLELVAKGLNSDIMLVPKEKLVAVLAVLQEPSQEHSLVVSEKSATESDANSSNADESLSGTQSRSKPTSDVKKSLQDDPWQDLLDQDPSGDNS